MLSSSPSSQGMKLPTSAEKVAAVNDLLIEILGRLPTKTVTQFKVVSKRWLSLISSPHFCSSHTRFLVEEDPFEPSALLFDVIYRQTPTELMFLALNPETKKLPLFDFIDVHHLKILQSCSGLLLCKANTDKPSNHFVCNPVTKKFRMITSPRPRNHDYKLIGTNLAFDPIQSPFYKVVLIWIESSAHIEEVNNAFITSSKYFMDIYDSMTDSWSLSNLNFTSKWDIHFDHGVFLDDIIYWDSVDKESLYFDTENNCVNPIPMPELRNYHSKARYFGTSGGYVQLVVGRKPEYLLIFIMYEMFVDRSGWHLKYQVDLDTEIQSIGIAPLYEDYEVVWLSVASEEEEGDSIVAVLHCGVTISYNVNEDKLSLLPKSAEPDQDYLFDVDSFRACPYFPTLCSV